MRVDGDGFKKVYSCTVFETCGPVRFHKDGKRVYMITNKGKEIDLARLVLFDPETGKEELVESDPMNRVDLGGPIFSEVTDELVGTVYEDERSRVYWRDARDARSLSCRARREDSRPSIGTGSEYSHDSFGEA